MIDTTVSRHHADLTVTVENCSYKDGFLNTSLTLKDVSKFVQTSVNSRLLSADERQLSLTPGDIIQFGACRDSFTVHYKRFALFIPDLDERPDIHSLAFRTGIPICELIEDSNVIVSEEVSETNVKVCHKTLI